MLYSLRTENKVWTLETENAENTKDYNIENTKDYMMLIEEYAKVVLRKRINKKAPP